MLVGSQCRQEVAVDVIAGEERSISREEKLLFGPCDGDIQLTVDPQRSILYRNTQQVKLVGLADGGGVDDDVALATLVAFHSVDGDVVGLCDAQCMQFMVDKGDLIAEWDNDVDAFGGLERQTVQMT